MFKSEHLQSPLLHDSRISDGQFQPNRQSTIPHDLYNNQMDDLNFAIDMLNSPKRFNLLLRGGVFGSINRLWSDMNDCSRVPGSTVDESTFIKQDDLTELKLPSHLPAKFQAIPLPNDLQTQMSLMSMHLAMGMLDEPIERVWIAIDDHLFIWDLDETDVGFIDLQCVATHVDFCKAPSGARNPKHTDIDKLLVVASTDQIKIFELKVFPDFCVMFDRPNESHAAMYEHRTPNDQIITSCCVSSDKTQDGRIFYGARNGRVFELVLSYSSFWGSSCKSVELTGFGPGLLRSVLSPIFFSSGADGQADDIIHSQRHVEQLCATSNFLLVRRLGQIQCADLVGSSWGSSGGLKNVRSLQVRALQAAFIDPQMSNVNQLTFIMVITDRGSRMVLNATDMQIVAEFSTDIGICSAAFMDCQTGICLVQRQEDGLILHTDGIGAYQPLLDHGTLWAFKRRHSVRTSASSTGLAHSRLAHPRMEYIFLTTNHSYLWSIDKAKDCAAESMSSTEVVISLADVLYPFWNRPLATTMRVDDGQSSPPFVSTMDSRQCHELKGILETFESVVVPAKANDLCQLIGDVIGCWHLLSVEHQLHAVMGHVPEKYRSELLEMPLNVLCSSKGQHLITALLNGLIQLYLDDRAATDALLARLRLVSPKFFSSDAVLLAQASELLQKSAQCYNNGKYIVDRRNVWAKEALNLLLRAAGSVDLELWAPALLKLGLHKELVRLTCLIAKTCVDPKDAALVYYINDLTPEEDIAGFQLMNQRCRL